MEAKHTAWRTAVMGACLYVEEINNTGKGDRYSYTQDSKTALKMTETECREFCKYMKECMSVGFWC